MEVTRPYSGEDDPDLPENVKKLSAKKRRQWVAVWNSTYESCTKDGGKTSECETKAFQYANGVIKKEQSRGGKLVTITSIFDTLRQKLTGKSRATSMNDLYSKLFEIVQGKDEQAWPMDLLLEDDGTLSLIIASQGKLYKAPMQVSNGVPSLGEWTEVKVDYPAVSQNRFTIHRTADGRVRWFSVSASAVLNRVGQIDSKELFDSFIKHIDETGEYPVRRFCHQKGDEFIIGQSDYVARDENLLITSGIYNDSELAQRDIAAHEKEPEYWGESIGFEPDKVEMVELTKDVTAPVYISGIMKETSSVPENYAAGWFTTTRINKEEENMLDKRAKEALVKLWDGDEAAADQWLKDNVDEANRMISDQNMITRTTEDNNDATPKPEPETITTQETTEPPETVPPTTQEKTLELDDAAIDAIVDRYMERQGDELQGIKDSVANLESRVAALEKEVKGDGGEKPPKEPPPAGETEQLKARLDDLEKRMDEAKQRTWFDDLPVVSTLRVTHRAKENGPTDTQPPTPPEPASMADVAESTMTTIKTRLAKK